MEFRKFEGRGGVVGAFSWEISRGGVVSRDGVS